STTSSMIDTLFWLSLNRLLWLGGLFTKIRIRVTLLPSVSLWTLAAPPPTVNVKSLASRNRSRLTIDATVNPVGPLFALAGWTSSVYGIWFRIVPLNGIANLPSADLFEISAPRTSYGNGSSRTAGGGYTSTASAGRMRVKTPG